MRSAELALLLLGDKSAASFDGGPPRENKRAALKAASMTKQKEARPLAVEADTHWKQRRSRK